MASLLLMPMPEQPPPPRRLTDDDVISLLEGPVSALYDQSFWLIKLLENHREIDVDLKVGLADLCAATLDAIRSVACVRCISQTPPVVRLGRGNGFDPVLCDDCVSGL